MRPPRFARWCLRAIAPADERHEVLADLDDEFARRAAAGGPAGARAWYRRQARASVGPFAARRLAALSPAAASRGLAGDVRSALRALRAAPRFSVAVVAMLAIGIGCHTVVYAVVDALVLRPLPFGDRSARLITVHGTHPTLAQDWNDSGISYPDLIDLRRESASLEGLEAAIDRNVSISTGRDTERVLAASVTPGLLPMLGVSPAIGRGFEAADAAEPGFEQVVLLGHALWQSLLGGRADVIGTRVLMNGRPLTVVGVMPQGFNFPDGQQLWLPYRGSETDGRANRGLLAIGLLRDGVALGPGLQDLQAVAARLAARHPDTNRDWSLYAFPIRDYFVNGADVEQLLAAVSLLLLAACANVAGLVIARGVARHRELAVRAALGAPRGRLVRLIVAESALLAFAGGVIGLLVAQWGIRALVAWIPEPPPYWATPELDVRVAGFALLVTGGVALLSGLLPALRLSRVRGTGALSGTRLAGATAHRRLQQALVVGQVAMSLVLLVGAVLLGRSATQLFDADPGFDRHPIFSARFYMAGDRYDPIDARAQAVADVVRRVEAIPGVAAATATGSIPSDDGGEAIRIVVPGAGAGADALLGGQAVPVSPGFWRALDLRLVAGRTFTASEFSDGNAPVAIVNRRLADRLWPGADAVDREIVLDTDAGRLPLRIVGVAPDLVYEEFSEETPQSRLNLYVPYARAGWRTQSLLVRTTVSPGTISTAVRDAVRAVDPGFAVYDALTMDDRRAFNHWGDRFMGRTFWSFAIAAMLLACVGAYALSSYAVERRRREVGVRLAIGATRADVVRLFTGAGGRLALIGIGLGLPAAAGVARRLQGELFRTSAWAPDLWVAVPSALLVAVIAASYLPARRAAGTDPAITLREEGSGLGSQPRVSGSHKCVNEASATWPHTDL
ncbi:MAG: ADOP family duplicated permease [Vicinamibacterales bacterium]